MTIYLSLYSTQYILLNYRDTMESVSASNIWNMKNGFLFNGKKLSLLLRLCHHHYNHLLLLPSPSLLSITRFPLIKPALFHPRLTIIAILKAPLLPKLPTISSTITIFISTIFINISTTTAVNAKVTFRETSSTLRPPATPSSSSPSPTSKQLPSLLSGDHYYYYYHDLFPRVDHIADCSLHVNSGIDTGQENAFIQAVSISSLIKWFFYFDVSAKRPHICLFFLSISFILSLFL